MSETTSVPKRVAFVQFEKFDATTNEFAGTMVTETPDEAGEIFDYVTSKPEVKKWIAATQKRSGGKSLGPVRVMHGLKAAGKLTDVTFDDQQKKIRVKGKVTDPQTRFEIAEGVLTGLSIGGKYLKTWPDATDPSHIRYTAGLSEVSVVDSPCVEDATLELTTSSGTKVLKFARGVPRDDEDEGEGALETITAEADEETDEDRLLAKAYTSVADLPAQNVTGFSDKEKRIYLKAFNAALVGTCKDGGDKGDPESCAFAVARSAVNKYRGKGKAAALVKREGASHSERGEDDMTEAELVAAFTKAIEGVTAKKAEKKAAKKTKKLAALKKWSDRAREVKVDFAALSDGEREVFKARWKADRGLAKLQKALGDTTAGKDAASARAIVGPLGAADEHKAGDAAGKDEELNKAAGGLSDDEIAARTLRRTRESL